MAQLVVTAVLVEGRSKSEVARQYGVSRRWVITLVQRYLAEGDTGLVPRSRRPLSCPTQTPQVIEDEIVAIRRNSTAADTRRARRRSRSTSHSAEAARLVAATADGLRSTFLVRRSGVASATALA